jgi:GntR family transcriptional regulator
MTHGEQGSQVPLESARSQYRQLADLIRTDIERGTYPPGSRLPSEPDLGDRYGVSRQTVNNAVQILRSEGLVRVDRGVGTIVRELPVITTMRTTRQQERAAGQARGAFQAEMERLGLNAESDVRIDEVPAPEDVAGHLGISPGETVLARERRMTANDIPVQLATSYLPMDIAAGTQLAEPDTGPGGTYSRLADLGYAPVSFIESVRVRLPCDDEFRLLGMDGEQRVITIRRLAQTESGRTVEVNDMVLPAHQWELRYQWHAK